MRSPSRANDFSAIRRCACVGALGAALMTGVMLAAKADEHAAAGAPQDQSPAQQSPAQQAPAQQAATTDYGRVGYVHVEGVIDRLQHRYFERALNNAKQQELDTLIVHIDTDGGEVFRAREMLKLALAENKLRLIAFVDYRAISAGALIAYGHEAIYLSKTASIGDIGVIFRSPEGKIEYAPEKIETVVRTLLTQAAETRGWPKGLLLKMTARNQTLYRVTLDDGQVEYVIEDDFPQFLARHPDIDRENTAQVIEYRGKDRLLTLTGNEAVELGMATGFASDLDALHRTLGVEAASVVDLSPTTVENIASSLSLVAPVLAGLAMLFILFEIKTPGVGLWAALAVVCGAAFLLAQYFLDLANNVEIVLMAIGIGLLIAEFFTMAGAGLLALVGVLTLFTGLVLAFLPNELDFDWTDERFRHALGQASMSGVGSFAIMAFGLVGFIYALPRSRFAKRMAVTAEITATSASAKPAGGLLDTDALVGQHGTARENLRPGGLVDVDGQVMTATVEHGKFIAAGAAIEVIGMRFGEVEVRPIDEPAPQD